MITVMMINWIPIRDMYLSGEPGHRVAAHFDITQRQVQRLARLHGFRRVDVGQRAGPAPPDDTNSLVRAALRACAEAASRGDAKGIEAAARAAERVLKVDALMPREAPPRQTPEEAQKLRDQDVDGTIRIYEAQRRYEAGCRDDDCMPLWQRFDRPDLRKPGELPIVYWMNGGRGPGGAPAKISSEEALYDMEVRWISEGRIAAHSDDTAAFRAQNASDLVPPSSLVGEGSAASAV